jgi:hypothetical protein
MTVGELRKAIERSNSDNIFFDNMEVSVWVKSSNDQWILVPIESLDTIIPREAVFTLKPYK